MGIKEEPDEEELIIESKDKSNTKFDSKKLKALTKTKTEIKTKTDIIDVPGDPFFLAKYRSFHNHDLDTNYVEHAHLVMDEDLHKKGSANLLP